MPAKLERCVEHLMSQGHDKESSYAICNHVLDLAGEAEVHKEQEAAEPKPQIIVKFYASETKALRNGDVEAYISTEAVDRVGDVIRATGWELENYRKSGSPVLFGHDYNKFPIGNAVDIAIQGKKLWSVTRFHEKTQQSKEAALMAREGIMKSWSVGFDPREKPEVRKDADGGFLGFIYNKQELLEYSLVSVPANPEAVSKALFYARKGDISYSLAYEIAGPSPLADKEGAPSTTEVKAVSEKARVSVITGLNAAIAAKMLKAKAGGSHGR